MFPLDALALVRRDDPDADQQQQQLPVLRSVIFYLILIVMAIVSSSVSYTFEKVVTAIAAVEDPNPDVYVRIETDTPAVSADDDVENLPPPKPVTSSLRASVSHLIARAGRWAPFRGVVLYMLTSIIITLLTGPASAAFHLPGVMVARFVAEVLLSNLRVGWVHIVISEPSTKSLWARIPSWRRTVVKIAPAAAIRAGVAQIVSFVPAVIANRAIVANMSKTTADVFLPGGLGLVVLYLVLYVVVQMPAEVTFIRVAASMLPEDDEAIVPFDRSFGGKVTPEIVGGQGKVGLVDAWRSFGWGSRMRLLSVVGKVFLMQMGLVMFFGLLLFAELAIFSP